MRHFPESPLYRIKGGLNQSKMTHTTANLNQMATNIS